MKDVTSTYRSRGPAIGSAVIAVIFLAWMAGLVVTVVEADKATVGIPLIAGLASPVVWMLLRATVAAVIVGPNGVVVRNIRRSFRLKWDEVEEFALGQHGLLTRVGLVKLKDGSVIAAWGIQGPNPATRPNNTTAERLIEQLNAELVASRHRRS